MDKDSDLSNAACNEIDRMLEQDRDAYLQAVKQLGKDPETDEEVEQVGVMFDEIIDAGAR